MKNTKVSRPVPMSDRCACSNGNAAFIPGMKDIQLMIKARDNYISSPSLETTIQYLCTQRRALHQ